MRRCHSNAAVISRPCRQKRIRRNSSRWCWTWTGKPIVLRNGRIVCPISIGRTLRFPVTMRFPFFSAEKKRRIKHRACLVFLFLRLWYNSRRAAIIPSLYARDDPRLWRCRPNAQLSHRALRACGIIAAEQLLYQFMRGTIRGGACSAKFMN